MGEISIAPKFNIHETYKKVRILNPYRNKSSGIATDGLVLHLDAGNTNSYPGTGNTWYDLSGSNYELTSPNLPVFTSDTENRPCFRYSANAQRFETTLNSPFSGNQFSITVNAVFSETNFLDQFSTILGQSPNSPTSGMAFQSAKGYYATDIWNPSGIKRTSVSTLNTIFMATWRIDVWANHKSTGEIYVNAVKQASQSYGTRDVGQLNTGKFIVGNWDSTRGDMNLNGDLYALNVYDRALSVEEIERNFAVYKDRFNLT